MLNQIHGCMGSAQMYFGSTRDIHSLADQKNILLIYPDTTFDSHCWDVASRQTLTHEGGGDSQSIVNMVRYAIKKYDANPDKVYVSGWSSGGMMTNVLAATYPDIFKAGSSISGTPHGCLAQRDATPNNRHSSPLSDNSGCPQGRTSKTGAQWADLVKSAYVGYEGPRPKMQLWHGTGDAIVKYNCLGEAIKQWSTVFGVQFSKNVSNDPTRGYTKSVYGDGTKLVAYSGAGVGHMDIPNHG
jgi:acetylxylan esterase